MYRRFLLMLAVALSSCAPKQPGILLDTGTTPAAVLLRHLQEREARLSSLVGRGIITFDSPELGGSASFASNMKKPDSLLVTLEGPFGVDVGLLFVSRQRYVLYNSMENSVATGDPANASLRAFIPFDLTYEQILNAFAGVFSVPQSDEELKDYRVDDENFLLSFSCGEHTCTYWIDPHFVMVTRFEQRSRDGTLMVDARATSFMEQDGGVVARRIRMTFPQQRRQLAIAYNSLTLNTPETDFRFTIPSNARQRIH